MEAFSDGVFSIAATLLVLDLALDPPGTPLEQVLHAWPAYLGYVVSFLTIGAAWLLHSAMTDRLARADSLLMRINLLLLLVIAFLPFPTKLVAEGIHDTSGERVFVTMYGLTLLTIRLLSFALDAYARREHLYADTQGDEELQTDRHTIIPVMIAYVVAILVGLALPKLAVALYFALTIYLVVPFRDIRRLLFTTVMTGSERIRVSDAQEATPVAKPDPIFLYLGTYTSEATARADYNALKDPLSTIMLRTYDAALVTQGRRRQGPRQQGRRHEAPRHLGRRSRGRDGRDPVPTCDRCDRRGRRRGRSDQRPSLARGIPRRREGAR